MRKLVTENKTNSKIIVHCSAGVGRTGTFIALYHYMKILDEMIPEYKRLQTLSPDKSEDASKMTIDIFNHVFGLRKQRCEMVSWKQKNNFILFVMRWIIFVTFSNIHLILFLILQVQSFPQYEFLHKCVVAYAKEVEDAWEKEHSSQASNLVWKC